MSAGRDWTVAEAHAWLKASLPKGWLCGVITNYSPLLPAAWTVFHTGGARFSGLMSLSEVGPTLRAACLALVRAAKLAGINVNAAPEPQGGGK